MRIGIPKENFKGERRVATTPDAAKELQKLGYEVSIESGAGDAAKFRDSAYEDAGVEVTASKQKLFEDSDIILKVREPDSDELQMLSEGQVFISFLTPAQNPELLDSSRKD